MFELNGVAYSLDQVEAAAKQSNLSLEEYVSKAGLNEIEEQAGKTQPQVTGAPVGETAAPDMVSKSEPGLLESLAAQTLRGFSSTTRGIIEAAGGATMLLAGLAKNISTGEKLTEDEKIGLAAMVQMGAPGIAGTMAFKSAEKKLSESVRESDYEGPTDALLKGDYAAAAELTVGGALESLPSTLLALTPGGITVMGASAGGNKFSEEFEQNPNESLLKLGVNATAAGIIEAQFERATRGLGRQLGLIPANKATQAIGALSKQMGKRFIKETGIAIAKEGVSEGATEATLIINDALTLGKFDDLATNLKRIGDATLIGGFTGGAMSTVSAAGGKNTAARQRAEQLLMPINYKVAQNKITKEINSLYEALQEEESEAGSKKIIEKIQSLEADATRIKKENSLNLSFLNNEDLKEYAANADKINETLDIITSDKSTETAKNLAREELNVLSEQNNNILENAKKAKFEDIVEKSRAEAEASGIEYNAYDSADAYNARVQQIKKENPGINIEENDNGAIVQLPNGSQEILINKEKALSEGAINVAAHELLHGVLFKTIKDSPDVAKNLGNALLDTVVKMDTNQFADSKFKKILEAYKKRDASEEVRAEEVLTNLSDAIVTGDLQFEENIFTKIGDAVRRTLQAAGLKEIRFNTGKDVYNFIKDYNRSIKRGKFNKAMREVTAKGAKGKLISETAETKADAEAASKSSISIQDKQNMMDTYNRLMEGVERNEYSKNNPLPRRLENELVPKFYNYVSTLVSKKFQQAQEEAIEKEDAIMILMAEVANALRTFNPAKNDDIAGYVASVIARRQSMIFADVNQEFTDNIEASKEAQAETEETPTEFSEKIQQADKKINLAQGLDTSIEIEGKTYEQHVKDALSKAVARAVKKVSEDISANRTVTPFVESIKSDIATELRKITKAFINKYGYEKFLIDHKDLILNNLTTTYLSKHPLFRKGIEKSIGGKMSKDNQGNPVFEPNFVLPKQTTPNKFEWVDGKGKKAKIDRDNAGVRGLTSGPEIMRRSPKINTIITENEFVDYHFQDGALRKKKKQNPEDALAMQIASEISFDYLKDDFLNEKEIFSKAQEYGEVLGVTIADAQAEEIAKDFDRGVVKYSITGRDLGWLIDTATLDSSDEFLIAEIRKRYKNNKKKIGQLIGFIEEGPLWLVKLAQVNKERNLGLVYEDLIGKILEAANITELNIKVEGRFDNSAIDLVIERKSKPNEPIKIELKLSDKAQMSSFTINDIVNLDTSIDIPADIKDDIEKALKDYDKVIDKYNKAATKKAKELGFEVIQPKTQGNNTMFVKTHADVFKAMQGDGFDGISQKDLNLNIPLSDNINLVEFLYKSKGVNYIQIGGKGLYFMGDNQADNVFNAPLLRESIKEIFITTRPTRSSSNKFGIATLPYRAFPKFKGVEPSYISLDNIKTVKNTLESLAKYSLSNEDIDRVNSMISETGKITKEEISEVTATRIGKTKGKFRFFIPPSADDFMGLMYYLLRKGKLGDQDLQFIKEKLIDPFTRAQANFDSYKIRTLNEFRQFKKLIRKIPKAKLSAKNDLGFTNEEAVRVYIWNKQGVDIPGISKNEVSSLVKLVEGNADLLSFANNVSNLLSGQGGYPTPQENWFGGSITIDVLEHINEISRKEFFAEFTESAEFFFGKLNNKGEISGPIANKLRAAYGDNYIEALSDILYRMKNGRAREFGKNKLVNQFNNWISNSVGAVMFLNARSALLQQVSLVNFINLTDNNPIKFAAAIANPKQYWSDYLTLINSDYLVQRRSGIKIDVNQDELVKAAESGRNPVQSVISLILKKGFVLTTWGDSHAIATGGAAFYRNRINTYLNDGLSQAEAEAKAFDDFKELAEESQQSSRPDRISKQQASTLGRLILAWANTPMQYARITKKAALDLINGRGDWKTNTSKLIYYGAIQNLMFTYLQQGLFAMIFDGEDDEEEDMNKYGFAFNSMADGFLRGLGFGGAVAATSKNMVLEAIDQAKGRGNYDEVVWEALKLSPPLGSKIAKARAVGRTFGWKQEREKVFTEGFSLDNPAFEAVGKAVSATTNIPLDRVVRKLDNITYPVRHETEFWQTIALYLGWGQWELGLKDVKKREKEKQKPKAMSTQELIEYMKQNK